MVSFNSVGLISRAESYYCYCLLCGSALEVVLHDYALYKSTFTLLYYASDFTLRAIKCCSVVFGVTFRLLVINTSLSSPAINKLRRLPATSVINLPSSVALIVLHLAVEQHAIEPDIG